MHFNKNWFVWDAGLHISKVVTLLKAAQAKFFIVASMLILGEDVNRGELNDIDFHLGN